MSDHGKSGLTDWLTTTDHKKIGIMYLIWAVLFFVIAGAFALVFRLELLTPEFGYILPGGEEGGQLFNSFVTLHGGAMVFLVAMPALAGLGNYLIPLMVGADDMAYPRLNGLGVWLVPVGGVLILGPVVYGLLGLVTAGEITHIGFEGGWTTYTPLSIELAQDAGAYNTSFGTNGWLLGVILLVIGSTVSSINFVVTAFNERDEDMGLFDMPLFVWAMEWTSMIAIVALAPLAVAFSLIFLEANFGFTFFNDAAGGDSILYQHLFWFFGHPEVYVVLLPFIGALAEIIPRFSHRPHWGYRAMLGFFAYLSIVSVIVWAHHMYTQDIGAMTYAFMALTLMVVVGFGILIFSWIATMWKGQIELKTPMLFSIGFILMLIFSGMDGIMLGSAALDIIFHENYWLVAHFHFTLFGASIMGFFAATYYWFPAMSGRMYNETLGRLHFLTSMAVAPFMFITFAFLGEEGMVRRYGQYAYDVGLQDWHMAATILGIALGLSQVIFVINVLYSLKFGPKVDDPWADNLEKMPSPEFTGIEGYKPPTPANMTATDGGPSRVDTEELSTDGGTTDAENSTMATSDSSSETEGSTDE